MTWIPPNIEPICSNALGNMLQCTSVGFTYLTLLAQLFGKPINEEPNEKYIDRLQNAYDTTDCPKIQLESESKREENYRRNIKRNYYDFIIVGGGSAGCVLANRLSEIKHWQILLLEAGEEEPNVTSIPSAALSLAGSSIDWGYKSQPDNMTCLSQIGQSCAWSSGKAVGGSSTINYMIYMRGSRLDYDSWAAEGNLGWSYEEVLPYFEKSVKIQDTSTFDNIGGPLNVERYPYVDAATKIIVQAFREKNLPYVNLGLETKVGVDINLSTSKNGKRQSANIAFIKPIQDSRPNLDIITNAFATKILIDSATKVAKGVKYYKNGKFTKVYAKKEVIISTGAIGSPKLLKLSGIGPRDELKSLNISVIKDLKVGYNLQNHVTAEGIVFSLPNEISTLVTGDQLLNEVQKYYDQPEEKYGPLTTTSTVNSVAYINTDGSMEDVPNLQFLFAGKRIDDFYTDPASYLASNIFPFSHYNGIGGNPVLLTPKSRGIVSLNQTDPIFSPPLIFSGFFQVQDDMDTLIDGINFLVSLVETEIFKNYGVTIDKRPLKGCIEFLWGSYDYFACLLTHYTGTIYHPVGTCKMGPSWDKDAVVDPRFRVYGIQKLRVIDASAMRHIVRGNTNAPTVMMAEKGSDMIKEDHNTKL